MPSTCTTTLPDYDAFTKESGQTPDGKHQYVTHKCFSNGVLAAEFTYIFDLIDYIPPKWPRQLIFIDYTDKIERTITTS